MTFTDIKNAWQTAKDHGLSWTVRRVYYELLLRSGHHKRRLPKRGWRENELALWLRDDLNPENLLKNWRSTNPQFFFHSNQRTAVAEAIKSLNPDIWNTLKDTHPQHLKYFSKLDYKVSYPDIWFTNTFTTPPSNCKPDLHWSDYPMYAEAYEDLKFIWEPGRFAIVYDLVRAYFISGEERFADYYWELIESWITHNPPNTGPHWKCGQETSLRLMAWYFGLFAFIDSPATTTERFNLFLMAVAAQVDRVSKDWQYSFIQQSNHAVSEGLGLYVTGLLFPQFKFSEEWKAQGKSILEDRALFLFREDGTYFQKSHNYLRFIIHGYLYVILVAEANGESFSQALKDRLRASVDYLSSVIDEETGYVPNFGSNDGALILPLNDCDFRDYRPTLAAAHYYLNGNLRFENGPWHEDLIWLFGPDSLYQKQESVTPMSRSFDLSGIYTLRRENAWMFMHAESIKDRPAHADALHFDFWWRGQNICCDPGTYLYYGNKPWRDAFKHTGFHNTITIDHKDQMERTYRFTWGYWHNAKINRYEVEGQVKILEAEHDGFTRLPDSVMHKRAVISLGEDLWVVVDDLLGKASHQIRLHWLLEYFPYQETNNGICLDTPKGYFQLESYFIDKVTSQLSIQEGDNPNTPRGWRSNYYGYKEKAISVAYEEQVELPIRIISVLGVKGSYISEIYNKNAVLLRTPNSAFDLHLEDIGTDQIYRSVSSSES